MIKVGIIGGAGYTAGELLRLLINHPETEIAFVQSESQAGQSVSFIHHDLLDELDMDFSEKMTEEPDLLFICAGHGRSRIFLEKNDISERIKIIDLSADFRHSENANGFVYGLPELNRELIKKADKIANPGCFATAIQLALLPLAKNGQLNNEVHIHAITGSTGAGQKPISTTHFSWRNNNVSIYKPFAHQHLKEIGESLNKLQPNFESNLNFLPIRGDFPRGIFASLYTHFEGSEIEANAWFQDYYTGHPFVKITSKNPALKQVVNTNNCLIHLKKIDNKLLIISSIDNLLKGASGQAVQNMNLLFGLPETTGLKLKASYF